MANLTTALREGIRAGEGMAGIMPILESSEWVDIASAAEDLCPEELQTFADLLPSASVAMLMEHASDSLRVMLCGLLSDHQLLVVLGHMQNDDAADVLGGLEPKRVGEVLSQMRSADRLVLTDLLRYPDETAGSIMTTAFVSVRCDQTAGDCLSVLRTKTSRVEQIQTVFVLEGSTTLVGWLDLRKILSSGRNVPVTDIMNRTIISVGPYDDREKAANLVAHYDLNVLPVVAHGNLLGVITVDDIIDVIIDEYDEDLLNLAGANKEETISSTLSETVRMRLPWLFVNLATAFAASMVVRVFEDTIAQVVALSAIMTIVSGMGGNAGSQTMAIVVRHLARETPDARGVRRGLRKEAMAGVIDGVANGVVTGLVVAAIYHNLWLSVVVLAAMVGNMVIAGTFGFLVPVVLKAVGQDPAVSSSIFVTTATDVLGFLIFLGTAQIALPLLV